MQTNEPTNQDGRHSQAAQSESSSGITQASRDTKKQGGMFGVTLALIALISSAPPVATDLYLPALPDMPAYFNTTEAIVNFTLLVFYFCMAVGMLILGPLSDKYGRRPCVLVSLCLFCGACLGIALSTSIYLVIAFRALQGIGGGGMVAIGTALVKDCFEGPRRERVLVIVQAIGVIAPMGAPLLGALILSYTTWQGTFIAMLIIGACAIPFAIILPEPLAPEDRLSEGPLRSFLKLGVVIKRTKFVALLLIYGICTAPFMTYLSVVSYVYIDYFEMSKAAYSIFFALNSALCAVGAFLVVPAQKRFRKRTCLYIAIGACLVSALLVFTIGSISPLTFLCSFAIFTLFSSFLRPITVSILLGMYDTETGSSASLINFVITVTGTLGMLAAGLCYGSYITGLGLLMMCCTGFALVAFAVYLRKFPLAPKQSNSHDKESVS